MITVYICDISSLSDKWFQQSLDALSLTAQKQISKYTHAAKRQQRIAGQVLLGHMLHDHATATKPDDIIYSKNGKPGLGNGLSFSLAYSAELAICAASKNSMTGIDVEQIKDVESAMLEDYFTRNEQELINKAADKPQAFYTLWVRKEAVLKAASRGVLAELNELDVIADVVLYEGCTYYLRNIKVKKGYVACVAADEKIAAIDSREIVL